MTKDINLILSFQGFIFPTIFLEPFQATLLQAKKRLMPKKWLGKPASKRLAYDRIHVHGHGNPRGEIGSPFRCDWKYLWMLHAKSFKEEELVKFEKAKSWADSKILRIKKHVVPIRLTLNPVVRNMSRR